ncbi:MAG: hypothetical protein NT040_18505 [Bacteroidetes bacterium]|nr:hypothetical protein [Bacteroidota bacterium]
MQDNSFTASRYATQHVFQPFRFTGFWSMVILLTFISGCISVKPEHLRRERQPGATAVSHAACYLPPDASHLFRATLDVKNKHISGLLGIKRTDTAPTAPSGPGRVDESAIYRIVLMNEAGMTLFDLELQAGSFKVISCFEPMHKKVLMDIFETDFRMLLGSGAIEPGKTYRQESTGQLVVSGSTGRYETWQTYSQTGDTLLITAAKSTIADPVIIAYGNYANGIPLKITITSPFIGMKIALRKLVQ